MVLRFLALCASLFVGLFGGDGWDETVHSPALMGLSS